MSNYNGWRNRATWLVLLWIDNEERSYLKKNATADFIRWGVHHGLFWGGKHVNFTNQPKSINPMTVTRVTEIESQPYTKLTKISTASTNTKKKIAMIFRAIIAPFSICLPKLDLSVFMFS